MILVDGRSGSGKTTLARRIVAESSRPVTLIRLDDIYPGWGGLRAGSKHLLEHVLRPLAAGSPARWRRWDWVADVPAEWRDIDPASALVIEGAGALSRANRALATYGIWVELDAVTRKQRVLARDGDLYAPHWDQWTAQEESFCRWENPRRLADIEICGVCAATAALASLGFPDALERPSERIPMQPRDDPEPGETQSEEHPFAPAPTRSAPTPKAGGKAKASKGKGRAPAVKGQPRPGKRRQSR